MLTHWCRLLVGLCSVCVLLLTACATASRPQPSPPDYWPTASWRADAAANRGFDGSRLASLKSEVTNNLPFIDSILVIRNGYIIHEEYFNGYDAAGLHHVHSVSKSFTSALVGMAQAQGTISNIDAKLADLLPEYLVNSKHNDKKNVSLRNLLMMRSGIKFSESDLNNSIFGGQELLQQDLTEAILLLPMAHRPGEAWNYSTADTQLVSAVFQRTTNTSLGEYAAGGLFKTLGIQHFQWQADKNGTTIGGDLLKLMPRDMAKLGLLYLHTGTWEGNQLIPRDWVNLTTTPQDEAYHAAEDKVRPIEWYGYMWWTWKPDFFKGHRIIAAEGYAGQLIAIIPDLDIIYVVTANSEVPEPQHEVQRKASYDLINSYILPAVIQPAGR